MVVILVFMSMQDTAQYNKLDFRSRISLVAGETFVIENLKNTSNR